MSKITVTGQLTLTGGQLTAKETGAGPAPSGYALWTWGQGSNGKLGLGDVVNRSSPVQIGALTDWAGVDTGGNSSLAIKTNGELWAWGTNFEGHLGLGDVVNRSSPVQVGALTNWASVSGASDAYAHNLAIKTNGELWAWGRNNFGQLGQGITVTQSSPVQIGSLTTWASVTVGGGGSRAIKTDGSLWSWGAGANGTLGLGDIIDRSSPVQVGILTDWASVDSASNHSATVKTDGSLWTWGLGTDGRLGHGNTTTLSSPSQVGSLTDWASISAGFKHTLAVKTDGTLWACGDNSPNGNLGDGTIINRSSPSQIGALSDWASASAGRNLSSARKTDGSIWAWGLNSSGQLGDGTVISRSSPVQIGSLTDWNSSDTSSYHTLALKTP